jgi:hypothetical protein
VSESAVRGQDASGRGDRAVGEWSLLLLDVGAKGGHVDLDSTVASASLANVDRLVTLRAPTEAAFAGPSGCAFP